jgi:hypothetical protein
MKIGDLVLSNGSRKEFVPGIVTQIIPSSAFVEGIVYIHWSDWEASMHYCEDDALAFHELYLKFRANNKL